MRIASLFVLFVVAACGGSGSTAAQIQLTASGASPSTITIPNGGQVHFINNDTADHQIASPCTDLASPKLTKGQDFLATLKGPNTCTFNDGLNPSVASFSGTVTVNAAGAGGGGGGSGY